ncbi:MAG TPA: hypothetical protein VF263_00945 [Longimicrobiaceae bacterium]
MTLVEALLDTPGVALSRKKGFGADALCIGDKIFAMLVRDRLVVKLPRGRVDTLVASGDGERFDTGNGRLMKEWLSVDPASGLSWPSLAREAREFVAPERG